MLEMLYMRVELNKDFVVKKVDLVMTNVGAHVFSRHLNQYSSCCRSLTPLWFPQSQSLLPHALLLASFCQLFETSCFFCYTAKASKTTS